MLANPLYQVFLCPRRCLIGCIGVTPMAMPVSGGIDGVVSAALLRVKVSGRFWMYGKYRRTLRCTWHDFWASAYYLLQVACCVFWCCVASAQFDSTDSTNLRNCRRLLSALVNGDPDTVSIVTGNIYDRFSDVWEVLRYADFPGMKDDLDSISTYTENSYYRLVNIESSTASAATSLASISDRLEVGINVGVTNDLVAIISNGVANALAAVPMAYAAATNVVDMSIVTNLATYFMVSPNLDYVSQDYFDLFAHYFTSLVDAPEETFFEDWPYYLAWTPVGFLSYLTTSALRPSFVRRMESGEGIEDDYLPFYSAAFEFWSQLYTPYAPDYTIFDAYNTLGLGVLTNQAASLLSIAIANTNLLTQIYSILGNSQYGVQAIAEAVSSASDSLETSGQADLDHNVNYDLPQWEPTYSREVDANTNVFEFDVALGTMTRSMLGDTTNQTGSLASNIGNIQPGGDLSLAFNFSGFNLGSSLQNFAPWSFSTSFEGLDEIKDFFKTLSRYMFYVLDLCLVIIGCRRIQHAIIGDVGIL